MPKKLLNKEGISSHSPSVHKAHLVKKGQTAFFYITLVGVFLTLRHIALSYAKTWTIAYSSDTALIGLMAKHILEFGERPIFVWSVGYQGVFMEAYLAALLFKIFGLSPATLNLAPTIYLILGAWIWVNVILRYFNRIVALLALALLTFSAPIWYHLCTRTMPNFASIFLLSSLFLLYLKHCGEDLNASTEPKIWRLFCLGVCMGFAQYTFAIHAYFILAALCFVVIVLSRPLLKNGFRILLTHLIWPANWLSFRDWNFSNSRQKLLKRSLAVLTIICCVTFAVGICSLVLSPGTFAFRGRTLRWNSILLILAPTFLWVGQSLLFGAYYKARSDGIFRRVVAICAVGFTVGYAPALVHKIFAAGNASKQFGVKGNWDDIARRFSYIIDFHQSILHFGTSGYLGVGVGLGLVLLILFHYHLSFQSLVRYLGPMAWQPAKDNQKFKEKCNELPFSTIFALLPPIIFAVFLTSRATVDGASIRYLIYLIPIYAVMMSSAAVHIWENNSWQKIVPTFIVCGFLFLGGKAIVSDLNAGQGINLPYPKVIAAMEKWDLKYGYADYWLAYATVFVANESVVLEPIYSNYAPHYALPVSQAKKIAYVDFQNARIKTIDGNIKLAKQNYKVIGTEQITDKIWMQILEKH